MRLASPGNAWDTLLFGLPRKCDPRYCKVGSSLVLRSYYQAIMIAEAMAPSVNLLTMNWRGDYFMNTIARKRDERFSKAYSTKAFPLDRHVSLAELSLASKNYSR